MRTDDRIDLWAKMEGKSEATSEDLLQRVAPRRRDRSEWKQLTLGVLIVLAFCVISFIGALRQPPTKQADRVESEETLAESTYRFRP